MCKSLMTLHILELIQASLQEVEKRSEKITEPDDFLTSETGVILMDSICMKLSAVGESIKNLDKITNHELLPSMGPLCVSSTLIQPLNNQHNYQGYNL